MKRILFVILFGLLVGTATSFGQTYLPGPFEQFANSFSVWLLCSFLVGYKIAGYKWAAVSGALVQLMALAGYYTTSQVRFDSGFAATSYTLMWFVGGLTAGPAIALAGVICRRRKDKYYWAAAGCMTLLFFLEAVWMFEALQYTAKGFCFVGAGILFAVIATAHRMLGSEQS